ncbi:hypothetical protein [Actinokineospora globicatena]|uniref:hypothetical protein n=1 Tax=Actinokineospora globicatena TaxID=103729 RepID=UPI0020A24237|nr:hypothetical protein [Actinokineospora globicatena]MCP2303882.1 hypothetical protein [Actinokineospora globicatena]GLW78960.1 hypothetical protein Aglo01_34420 [Actinokineospora globicatena]GLW86629.1 hypothetical protein Aglo02_42680 [Actinokineospora globicatena]
MTTTIPSAQGEVTVGDVLRTSRTYTVDEVREFQRLSGYPDNPQPRFLPYLLVVAPLTKLGGDIDYLSGRMTWSVRRPVAVGEEITAELEITRLEPVEGATKIGFDARIRCGDEVVVTGTSKGLVLGENA